MSHAVIKSVTPVPDDELEEASDKLTDYQWLPKNEFQGGNAWAGDKVSQALFQYQDVPYTVEFFDMGTGLTSNLGTPGTHLYQVGIRSLPQYNQNPASGDYSLRQPPAVPNAIPIARRCGEIVMDWIQQVKPSVLIAGDPDGTRMKIYTGVMAPMKSTLAGMGYSTNVIAGFGSMEMLVLSRAEVEEALRRPSSARIIDEVIAMNKIIKER